MRERAGTTVLERVTVLLLLAGSAWAQEPVRDPFARTIEEDRVRSGVLSGDMAPAGGGFDLDLAEDLPVADPPRAPVPEAERDPGRDATPRASETSILGSQVALDRRFREYLEKNSSLPLVEEVRILQVGIRDGGKTVAFEPVESPTSEIPFHVEVRFSREPRGESIALEGTDEDGPELSLADDPFAEDPEGEGDPTPVEEPITLRPTADGGGRVWRTPLLVATNARRSWDDPARRPLDLSPSTRKRLERWVGKWRIQYDDAALGTVTGTAVFGFEDRRFFAVVAAQSPATGRSWLLRQEHLEVRGDELVLDLKGTSPSPQGTKLAELLREARPVDRAALRIRIVPSDEDLREYERLAEAFTRLVDDEIRAAHPAVFKAYVRTVPKATDYALPPGGPADMIAWMRDELDRFAREDGTPSPASWDGLRGTLRYRNDHADEAIGPDLEPEGTDLTLLLSEAVPREIRPYFAEVEATERYGYDGGSDSFELSFQATKIRYRYDEGRTAAHADLAFARTIPVAPARDPRHVRLALAIDDSRPDELVGTWRSPCDAGFPAAGQRAGAFDAAARELHGRETWTRHEILGVLVMDGQQAREDGTGGCRYPSAGVREADAPRWRTLFVYGRNLTDRRLRPIALDALAGEGVEYSFLARSNDPDLRQLETVAGSQGWLVRKAWELLGEPARLGGWDGILVQARLQPGILPGLKSIRLRGGQGTGLWPLAFSDATATISFVREVGAEFEAAPVLFRPERIRIEVRCTADLPLDEVPVLLGHAGEPILRLQATRLPASGGVHRWRTREIVLVRPARGAPTGLLDPGDPVVLAAGAMDALPGPGEPTIGLQARIGVPHLLPPTPFYVPRTAEDVATNPDVPRSGGLDGAMVSVPIFGSPARLGLTWKEALVRVARQQGVPLEDFGEFAQQTSTVLSNVILTKLGRQTLRVTHGDHAAMLILKEAFQSLLASRSALFREAPTADQLDAYVEAFRRMRAEGILDAGEDDPLGRIPVEGGAGGVEVPLHLALAESYLSGKFGTDEAAAREFERKSVQRALARFREAHEHVVAKLEACGDGDVETLLSITGFGFENVVSLVVPRLFELRPAEGGPSPEFWVPDRVARAQIQNLRTLGDALRAQEDYASFDKTYVQIVTLPLQLYSGFVVLTNTFRAAALFYYVDFALNVADLAMLAGHDVPEFLARREELRFAIGSAAILGVHRLKAAEKRAGSTIVLVGQLALGGVGVVSVAGDLYSVGRYLRLQRRADAALPDLEAGGLAALERLPEAERADVQAFFQRTLELQDDVGLELLNRSERRILAALGELKEVPDPSVPGGKVARYSARQDLGAPGGGPRPAGADPGAAATPDDLVAPVEQRVADQVDALRKEDDAADGIGTRDVPPPVRDPDSPEAPPPAGAADAIPDGSIEPLGQPVANTRFEFVDVDGQRKYHLIGSYVNEGNDVRVFELLGTRERVVIKFLKDKLGEAIAKGVEFGSRELPSEPWEVLRDMLRGKALLDEAADIPYLPIYHASTKHRLAYFIQRYLPDDYVTFKAERSQGALVRLTRRQGATSEVVDALTAGQQEAVLRLYRKLADKGLIWEDAHLGNVYFRPLGGDAWEAGILDTDRIAKFGGFRSDRVERLVRDILDTPAARSNIGSLRNGHPEDFRDAAFFMEKILEYKLYIQYDAATGAFQRSLLDPDVVRKFFPDLDAHVIR